MSKKHNRDQEFIDWYYSIYKGLLPDDVWHLCKIVWNEAYEKGKAAGVDSTMVLIRDLDKANAQFRDIIKASKAGMEALKLRANP